MHTAIKTLLMLSLFTLAFASCNKDEDDEMDELHIEFKVGGNYTSTNMTLPKASTGIIGIEAETKKPQDPIISFNISLSISGGTPTTVYNESNLNAEFYDYDYVFVIGSISGDIYTYTFTITNKDGLTEQESLTVTIQ